MTETAPLSLDEGGCPMRRFPAPRTDPLQPPTDYAQLLDSPPVTRTELFDGSRVWAVSGHAEVRALLADSRLSSDRRRPGFPVFTTSQPPRRTDVPRNMIAMDPPEHGPARRAVVGEFTAKRIAALRPWIQQIVDERIDALLAAPQPADLVRLLALPVPSLVICALLGVPYDDHEFFETRSARFLSAAASREERAGAVDELRDYMHGLVSAKEAAPSDDLIGRQIEAGTGHDDLVELAILLLIAGHETTANMIALGTVALLDRPHLLQLVREQPDRVPDVVEELLRHFTVAERVTVRVAAEDIEVAGVRIRAGEGVVLLTDAANHDPDAFPAPEELDPDREEARRHLAFGYGPHLCLGANLARAELRIVFTTLFDRVPTLQVAVPRDELVFRHDSNIYGLESLPVRW
ncbi:cytochrome P450 [Pseudonocardia kongjuensis]|uniref:Cytochrome P450 n=1 Tax=Pseudonocardia kongjuensis TaxID=102227 RepID=A0ABP4IAA9_9PSEU